MALPPLFKSSSFGKTLEVRKGGLPPLFKYGFLTMTISG